MEGILQQFINKFNANPTLSVEKPLSITPWYFRSNEVPNTAKNALQSKRMGKFLFNAIQKYFDNPFAKQDVFQTHKAHNQSRGLKIHTAFTPYSDAQWMQWIYDIDAKLQNENFQCVASTDARMQRGAWLQQTLKRSYRPIHPENTAPYVLNCEIILKESNIVNIHWMVEYQNTDIPHATFVTSAILCDALHIN